MNAHPFELQMWICAFSVACRCLSPIVFHHEKVVRYFELVVNSWPLHVLQSASWFLLLIF